MAKTAVRRGLCLHCPFSSLKPRACSESGTRIPAPQILHQIWGKICHPSISAVSKNELHLVDFRECTAAPVRISMDLLPASSVRPNFASHVLAIANHRGQILLAGLLAYRPVDGWKNYLALFLQQHPESTRRSEPVPNLTCLSIPFRTLAEAIGGTHGDIAP
jgi:hypothetical protein